jgi:hypothetical protein
MNDRHFSRDHDPSSFIDRLAADELDDDSRRALFAWLDREPARWRRCALALLEAREVESAFDDWLRERSLGSTSPVGQKRPIALPDPSEPVDERRRVRRQRSRGQFAMLAIAASVALAFGLGMAADRRLVARRAAVADPQAVAQASPAANGNSRVEPPQPGETAASDSQQPVVSGDGDEKGDGGRLSQQSETVASTPSSSGEEDLIPAYVKSQLERHGYRVDSRRQFVSVSLPDGRRALVPLERWKFSYVGNRAL